MISVRRFLLFIIGSFMLLTCMAMSISAQKPRPTPNINDPVMRFPSDKSKLPTEVLRVTPAWSVSGKIRWRKEYGMVPTGPASNTASPIPCGQHFAAALKTVNDGGSFARLVVVNSTPNLPNKIVSVTEAGDYYVCSYTIPDLPKNTSLLIMAGMGGTLLLPQLDPYPLYHTLPWIGGSQPQPPPGYERAFIGSRSVTLTDAAPRATVDFEMVYQPISQGPR
jgi:hypothetical protein